MKLIIFTLFVGLLCLSVKGEFPDDPKPCKYEDAECIKDVINYLFKEKLQGDSSINLPKLFPLAFESVHLHQGEESPVSIDLELKNNNIYGIETAKAVKVKGFGKDLTKKNRILIHTDYLSTIGDYEINGKILILPITGSGNSNITMIDVNMVIEFVGAPFEKDGATYMKIDKINVDAEPKRMIYKVDNLFNGDKELGDNMNLFLNENWQEIYAEVRTSLGKAFAEVFTQVINQVFSKYPYDKFFTE